MAGTIGALVVVAGFATLFFAKNEGAVAVAVAFVVGLVLLVMAVQGTPLIKVGGKDVSVELSRREVIERAKQIAVTRSPAEDKGFLEGVNAAKRIESAGLELIINAVERTTAAARRTYALLVAKKDD